MVCVRLDEPNEGTRYALTSRGEALRPIIDELIRWSGPLMASGPGDDVFQPRWLAVALPALLPKGPARPVVIGLHTQDAELTLEAGPSGSVVHLYRNKPCEVTISADPDVILGLASGALSIRAAVRNGARISGNRRALARALGGQPKTRKTKRSRS